jgi:hypothetical protein
MSDSTCIVLGAIAGLMVLGVLSLGAMALWLGRPLRAQGRARLGSTHEFAVAVEVPEATAPKRLHRLSRPRIPPVR